MIKQQCWCVILYFFFSFSWETCATLSLHLDLYFLYELFTLRVSFSVSPRRVL